MKRKILSTFLVAVMVTTIFTGCGKKEDSSSNAEASNDSKVEVQQEETDKEESNDAELEENVSSEPASNYRTEMVVSHEVISDTVSIEEDVYDEKDTIRTKYVYDESGILTDIFLYDENGNKIQNFIIDSSSNYVYDSMGTYTELTYWNDGDKFFQRWEYDSYGNEINYDYVKNDERTQGEFYNYEYDTDGKVIKRYNNSEIVYYEYDENGNLTKETICDSDEEVDNYYLYKCDDKGNVLERAFYEAYGNGDEFLEYTEVMTYDNNNDVDSSLKYYSEERYPDKADTPYGFKCTYDYKPNVNKYDYYHEYRGNTNREIEYDDNGRISSASYTNGDTKYTYTYNYNSNGKIDLITHEWAENKNEISLEYLSNGCDKSIITTVAGSSSKQKQEYLYDENGLLIKFIVSAIPEGGEIEVLREQEFTYNTNGIISGVTITKGDDIEVLNFE